MQAILFCGIQASGKSSFYQERFFNHLPAWQKRGVGLLWGQVEKEGFNPKTKKAVKVMRRQIVLEEKLPMKDAYAAFIRERIAEASESKSKAT